MKAHFSQEIQANFEERIPWYDPTLLIPAGKEFFVTEDKELIFVNEELIQGQKDSLRFVIKQIGANLISGKSIVNVSLPVDIFEPRSLLERAASVFSCAPKYLKGVAEADVVTQMKAMVGFQMSVPPLELIMQKPFNPILGETFQAYIGGIPFYLEQISHHPPISAYYMKCDEFTLYGNLIPIANVSLNSGWGGNIGRMNVIMKNGNHFEISFPSAEISGLIYGKRKYAIKYKGFVINQEHRLLAEVSVVKESKGLYEREKNEKTTKADILGGIFRITENYVEVFQKEKNLLSYQGLKKSDVE